MGDEYGFLHVFQGHFDMVVNNEAIHEAKDRELSSVVHQYIDVRKREIILRIFPI